MKSVARVIMSALLLTCLALPASAQDPLQIDVILPLTGNAAFLGGMEQLTLKIEEKYINQHGGVNGTMVAFSVQDDGSTPQTTVALTNGLLAKNARVIVGSSVASLCGAMAPIVDKAGPFTYCLSPVTQPHPGSYMFAASVATGDTLPDTIAIFKRHGWTRIALMTSTDASGKDYESQFMAAMAKDPNSGVTVVANETFANEDLSVAAQIARVKAAKPQVLATFCTGAAFGTLIRTFTDAGLTIPLFGSAANLNRKQLSQYKAFAPKLNFVAGAGLATTSRRGKQHDAQAAFAGAFRDAGLRVEWNNVLPWDPIMLVVDAMRHLGPAATADQMRTYVSNITDWTGIAGTYNFKASPQRGLDHTAATVYTWNSATDEIAASPASRF
jgi:branched-chain amino acid transport system substrate-binding protein